MHVRSALLYFVLGLEKNVFVIPVFSVSHRTCNCNLVFLAKDYHLMYQPSSWLAKDHQLMVLRHRNMFSSNI
jgi:hypothetical protein